MPTVEFTRTLTVPANISTVWATVTDVAAVSSWISVISEVEEIERLRLYRATLTDRMGPFRLSADLSVEVTDLLEARNIRFVADGEDRELGSRIQVDAGLALESDGEGTRIQVEGRYEITGKAATLGASMIRSKAEKILEEFFANAEQGLS
jgi:carbon monoxide dehydrogenase subunit G